MSILVVYASKHGSTQGIAERIAQTLRRLGKDVETRPVSAVTDVEAYEAVVIGSAVYFGSWLKEATELVRQHRAVLAGQPVWLFSSGPVGTVVLPDPQEIVEFQAAIGPRGYRNFAGALDRGKLSLGERMLAKAMKAPYGDFRNWDAIEDWAAGIARELASSGATPRPAPAGSV